MSTSKTITLTYNAPLSDVSAMLHDPEFRQRVCEAQHASNVTVEIDGGTVSIGYTQQVSGVPGFAKKFVGDSIDVEQLETWNGGTHGKLSLSLPGKPGSLSGTAVLAETDGRTTETVELTAAASVPFVGGKLENLVLDIFAKALAKENEVGAAYLAG